MGRAKAWLPFAGELLLPRVVRLVSEVAAPVVVVAAPAQELPDLPAQVLVVRDEEKGRGPLQGLLAGLMALEGRAEAGYASSCDVPFLRPAFVRRVIDCLGDQEAAVPRAGGYTHPLAAVYRTLAIEPIRQLLAADRLRPLFLFETLATRYIEESELREADPELESLWNLNTPEEYAAALNQGGKRGV